MEDDEMKKQTPKVTKVSENDFLRVYEEELTEAKKTDHNYKFYGTRPKDQPKAMALAMYKLITSGQEFNNKGPAFVATLKKLGIKNDVTIIREALKK